MRWVTVGPYHAYHLCGSHSLASQQKTHNFLEVNNIMSEEQKGCRRNSRVTKDQLLIGKSILRDCKQRHTNLAMARIDYQKAYDMVLHSWVKECMQMFGMANNIKNFLGESMKTWRTELTVYDNNLGQVRIGRGIFQEDNLSKLIFVLSMIPLTLVLRKIGIGYEWGKKQFRINHLLFTDDLKLFGNTENQIDSLINSVRMFSMEVGMEFRIKKSGCLILKREGGCNRRSSAAGPTDYEANRGRQIQRSGNTGNG